MSEKDVIAQARGIYEQIQDRALAATPLSEMSQWIETGAAATAQSIRAFGFTSEGLANAADLRLARKAFTRRWGFSIPCAEAIDILSDLGPLVEIGAGTGYWSALARNAGIDIVATDPAPASNAHGFQTGRYIETQRMAADEAIRANPGRSVFCSWPTEGETWATDAVAQMEIGRRLALIGTARGGITGAPSLFDLLDAEFQLEQTLDIPQFPQVADYFAVYVRASRHSAEGS